MGSPESSDRTINPNCLSGPRGNLPTLQLSGSDKAFLDGERGKAAQFAMEMVVAVAESERAATLVDIEQAHVDGCLFHGQALLDFANFLMAGDAVVSVPTTLNVSSLDLLHPELYRGGEETALQARRLMDAYVEMGCTATWTCAPYQLASRPRFGEQVAWGESNAIVFANSVLGARTGRYGDFMDICCAITGRAPFSGLHTDEGRLATIQVDLAVSEEMLDGEIMYPILGHLIGRLVGQSVPVITGLDRRASEDRLKALGAGAASSGTVAMFHIVGVTPEAGTLDLALGGLPPERVITVGVEDLDKARAELDRGTGPLGAVSVGTPHLSLSELTEVVALASGRSTSLPFYLNTSRDTLEQAVATGVDVGLRTFGATVVTDTCTYITPIMEPVAGDVMTNSAKWAYYAPANLGVDVAFGCLSDCVESAIAGHRVATGRWR
jgi:predicted aconitase